MGWRRVPVFLVVLVLSLLAAACGENSDRTTTTTTAQDQTSSTEASPESTSPQEDTSATQDDGGGQDGPSTSTGTGFYRANFSTFSDVEVVRCEPDTSATGGPHPDNLVLVGRPVGSTDDELRVEVLHDLTAGDDENNPMLVYNVSLSMVENQEAALFDGHTRNDADGTWVIKMPGGDDMVETDPPFEIHGNHITGWMVTLLDDDTAMGFAKVDFDFEIPTEITPGC